MSVATRFTISPFEFFTLRTRLRFPFRYGIASMTEVPQLFMRTRVTVGGSSAWGLAAEGLPPKWFTKDPATTFEQDLPDMMDVIGHAARLAADIARQPIAFFDLWRELDRAQGAWARERGIAPLLAHLGVSLVERAVLDGICRIAREPLHHLVRNDLGIRLGDVYPELRGLELGEVLPSSPAGAGHVRHTIGLADALTAADLRPEDRVDDGLPQDLEASIRAYGLRYFKVKLSAALDRDVPRLRALVDLLARETDGEWFVTLDGNENFHDFGAFRQFWEQVRTESALADLWRHVIVVEQPVHRNSALSADAGRVLGEWTDRPPIIIDESDGAVGDVPAALDLGYVGASHKNCKGIVKGLANAAMLARRRGEGRPGVLTGEDLCILGPVALLQDLAMMALLGIAHIERNGHHYYRGLSMMPESWQDETLAAHGDIYRRHADGFACLDIVDGAIRLGSANQAPFGVQPELDPSVFTRLESEDSQLPGKHELRFAPHDGTKSRSHEGTKEP